MVVDWLSLCGDTAVEITNNNSVCVVLLYCTVVLFSLIFFGSTADLFRVDPHLFFYAKEVRVDTKTIFSSDLRALDTARSVDKSNILIFFI